MLKIKSFHRVVFICFLLIAIPFIAACSNRGKAVNPADWGYDCVVIYDALGGTVNSREIRETYYMKNSYLFKPSGTTSMLIEPVNDGYILTGWYTAKEDIVDNDGNTTGYSFKAEDRWDFDEDRVQGNLTLYARWIPQGKVSYVDASTGEVKFSKNITYDSPIQKLSGAIENLIAKDGYTFYGYFSDKECTMPYDFSDYMHADLLPTNKELYDQLYKEFPEYFREVVYEEVTEDDDERIQEDTSDLFINKLGYEIVTDDKSVRQKIRARKDEIIEEYIQNYMKNTAERTIYLKYVEGRYIRADSAEKLKSSGKYGFSGLDSSGNPVDGYILLNDIDFKGISMEMAGSFSGKIYGNGFKLKNITINVASRKLDTDTSKSAALFNSLDGAYIEDLTFENYTININVQPGIPVTVGALAMNANNTTLKNVTFDTLKINTGRGDDGSANYKISDLFVNGKNSILENVTGNNIEISASEYAHINSVLLPPEQE